MAGRRQKKKGAGKAGASADAASDGANDVEEAAAHGLEDARAHYQAQDADMHHNRARAESREARPTEDGVMLEQEAAAGQVMARQAPAAGQEEGDIAEEEGQDVLSPELGRRATQSPTSASLWSSPTVPRDGKAVDAAMNHLDTGNAPLARTDSIFSPSLQESLQEQEVTAPIASPGSPPAIPGRPETPFLLRAASYPVCSKDNGQVEHALAADGTQDQPMHGVAHVRNAFAPSDADLKRVRDGDMLNDIVVSAYINLCKRSIVPPKVTLKDSFYAPRTFLAFSDNKSGAITDSLAPIRPSTEWVVIPVCTSKHWVLIVAHFLCSTDSAEPIADQARSLQLFVWDSLNSPKAWPSDWVLRSLEADLKRHGADAGQGIQIRPCVFVPCAQQTDGKSCGIYMLHNLAVFLASQGEASGAAADIDANDPRWSTPIDCNAHRAQIHDELIHAQRLHELAAPQTALLRLLKGAAINEIAQQKHRHEEYRDTMLRKRDDITNALFTTELHKNRIKQLLNHSSGCPQKRRSSLVDNDDDDDDEAVGDRLLELAKGVQEGESQAKRHRASYKKKEEQLPALEQASQTYYIELFTEMARTPALAASMAKALATSTLGDMGSNREESPGFMIIENGGD